MRWLFRGLAAVLSLTGGAVGAQVVQGPGEALAVDAADYAARHGVSTVEALRRLYLQQESVPATDRIARDLAPRLAGIAIAPETAIDVLLTGTEPVADELLQLPHGAMPVHYRTGAAATRAEVVAAIGRHQAAIRAMLSRPPGLGYDARSGEMVVSLGSVAAEGLFADELERQLEELTGVPVRVVELEGAPGDLSSEGGSVEGGARVVGINPADGRRYSCTTGYVVTDGSRTGVVTAAHCPDALSYVAADRTETPLSFEGQWGWSFQDVQLHLAPVPLDPSFYADTAKSVTRPVTAVRPRASTRAGDTVCHRGERTGYSCAEVMLTDFAPAGDLCGGPCAPTWVAVDGPTCRAGDSGGPVFVGTTALGIVKGGSYAPDGRCNFYFYMSTDYLPTGWSPLLALPSPTLRP